MPRHQQYTSRPFRRRPAYPWWVWAAAPVLVIGVIGAMLALQ